MKNILFICAIIALSFATLQVSQADVVFIAQETDGEGNEDPFTQGIVDPTDGEEGDFEILGCATASTGANMFTDAEPDWNEINQGGCGGGPDCILGIYEKFSPEPNNTNSICNWTEGTNSFAGFVFRYRGTDPVVPVTDFACNTGVGITATAPSINTTEGSIVARIYTSDTRTPAPFDSLPGAVETGKIWLNVIAGVPAQPVTLFAYNEFFEEAGVAPAASIPLNNIVDDEWRACSVSIRMAGSPIVAPIPTLSKWGLIAFALFAGAMALIFLRRKSLD